MRTIPLSKPFFNGLEKKEVLKVLLSGKLVQGQQVARLENQFKKVTGAKFSIATNNGTSALHTALHSIGTKPGDEVITTPFTFIASANSILMVGAKPVFVDIEPDSLNIDPNLIENAITPKTKAIIVVNLFGQPANFHQINQIAKKHKLLVVEDSAQSIGAHYQGRRSGNLADVSCFSLYATKNVTSAEGGIITTNSESFFKKCVMFRQHGQLQNQTYDYLGLGYNYRMTDIQAAIGNVQMSKLAKITKLRQKIARLYNEGLSDINWIKTPVVVDESHVYHQYTIQVQPVGGINRDSLSTFLKKHGVQTKVFYPKPLFEFPHLSYRKPSQTEFPIARKIAKKVLSLPIYPSLKEVDVRYIVDKIHRYGR